MTDIPPLRFTFARIERFCTALREAVDKRGGASVFFHRLSGGSSAFIDAFRGASARNILGRCLDDLAFRAQLLAHIEADPDREFVSAFLAGWDLWKEFYREDHEWLKLALVGAATDQLMGPIPYRVNQVMRCSSTLQLDSYFEEFRVKTSIQLAFANKTLGGDGVLISSEHLSGFIESVRLMLSSLVLGESERGLFRLPSGSPIIGKITEELKEIRDVVDTLEKQFQGMALGEPPPNV